MPLLRLLLKSDLVEWSSLEKRRLGKKAATAEFCSSRSRRCPTITLLAFLCLLILLSLFPPYFFANSSTITTTAQEKRGPSILLRVALVWSPFYKWQLIYIFSEKLTLHRECILQICCRVSAAQNHNTNTIATTVVLLNRIEQR